MTIKKTLIVLFLFTISLQANSQNKEGFSEPSFNFSAFTDVYYAYDFNQPENHERPDFLFNHKRHNELNVNLGLVQMDVKGDRYRANLGLMVGNYAQYNLAEEPDLLKNIFEAYVGIALDTEEKLWLDAGVFSSHLGFESAVSTENYTLTRSLAAENSPYFLSGVRLTYQPNSKLQTALLITNGWQRIVRPDGNQMPALGTQLNYSFNENFTFNWSTFIGNDFPESERRMRYFNNFYLDSKLSEKVSLITGFDIGFQQSFYQSNQYDKWFTPVAILHYRLNEKWALAGRAEYFQDQENIIVSSISPNGFNSSGFSLNVDYHFNEKIKLRVEGRSFIDSNNNFVKETDLVNSNSFVVGSMAVKF